MKRIVVIGGGTGTYTVLSGLKSKDVDLTAIVSVADSGGSTGRLRDEFGYLPVGDYRMALVALSDIDEDSNVLRDLFMFRFNRGNGLSGHNFGNLLLTALSEMLESEEKAFEHVSKILRVKGSVLPITYQNITLVAEYADGSVVIGEDAIDEPLEFHDANQRIINLSVQPNALISPAAKEAILEADLITLGPGDLYTSILANVVVDGSTQVLQRTRAKIVFTPNLINKYAQTPNFTALDYVEEFYKYVGRYPDYVVVNSTPLPDDVLRKYAEENGYPVVDNLEDVIHYKVIRADLLADEVIVRKSGDTVRRSLIRHDAEKFADTINSILESC